MLIALALALQASQADPEVCGCCGSTNIDWAAHVRPNENYRRTWVADDHDSVWCDDCAEWGGGSIPRSEYLELERKAALRAWWDRNPPHVN